MGMFDWLSKEDDEQEVPQGTDQPEQEVPAPKAEMVGPPTREDAPKSDLDNFLASYKSKADDNTTVKDAESKADRSKMWTGIIQGLSTAFAGHDRTDSNFYNGLRANADQSVADARNAKKQSLDNMIQGYQFKRQGVEDQRAAEAFKWKEADENPDHPKAAAARTMLGKRLGLPATTFDGMNYRDMVEAARLIEAKRASEGSPQQFKYTDVDGKVKLGMFKNGQYLDMRGRPLPDGITAGFALATTPDGLKVNKATGDASEIVLGDGTTATQHGTDTAATRAGANAMASGNAKNVVKATDALADAQSKEVVWNKKFDNYLKLHQQAQAEGWVGSPMTGAVALKAQKYGITMGNKTDTLANLISRDLIQYVQDVSGKTVSDKERENIEAISASIKDQPELFASKVNAFRKTIADKTAMARQKRDILEQQLGQSGPAATPPAATNQFDDQAVLKAAQDVLANPSAHTPEDVAGAQAVVKMHEGKQ